MILHGAYGHGRTKHASPSGKGVPAESQGVGMVGSVIGAGLGASVSGTLGGRLNLCFSAMTGLPPDPFAEGSGSPRSRRRAR